MKDITTNLEDTMIDLVNSLPDNKARTVVNLYKQHVSLYQKEHQKELCYKFFEKDGGIYIYCIQDIDKRKAFIVKKGKLTTRPKSKWDDLYENDELIAANVETPAMLFIPYKFLGQFIEVMESLIKNFETFPDTKE